MSGIRKVAYLVAVLASTSLAQTGDIPVDIKGRILDLTGYPPADPIDRSEPFDTGSMKGAQVAFDLDSGNLVFFSTNPKSAFSSVNNLGDGSGLVASNLFQPSGNLAVHGGSSATAGILYAGSLDNPLWFGLYHQLQCQMDG